MSNRDNPKIGKLFQNFTKEILEEYFGQNFEAEVAVPIGNPPKKHRFDCASADGTIVVECKAYVWTKTGNVPSAKLMGLNEAVFYMSHLPEMTTKILCMKKSEFPQKTETFAEYYCRINAHLLRDIKVFEIDEYGEIRIIKN